MKCKRGKNMTLICSILLIIPRFFIKGHLALICIPTQKGEGWGKWESSHVLLEPRRKKQQYLESIPYKVHSRKKEKSRSFIFFLKRKMGKEEEKVPPRKGWNILPSRSLLFSYWKPDWSSERNPASWLIQVSSNPPPFLNVEAELVETFSPQWGSTLEILLGMNINTHMQILGGEEILERQSQVKKTRTEHLSLPLKHEHGLHVLQALHPGALIPWPPSCEPCCQDQPQSTL